MPQSRPGHRQVGPVPAAAVSVPHPTLLVDLSNVCRDEALGRGPKPTLRRLDRLLGAWRTLFDADTTVLCFVDRSLGGMLDAGDRRRLNEMIQRRTAVVPHRGEADVLILRQAAADRDATILSRDGFVAYRRAFPWIEGELDRFYTWSVSENRVILRPQDRRPVDFEVSRAEELEDLRSRGFLDTVPASHPILRHRYRCVSAEPCMTRAFHPEMLRVPPALGAEGSAVCPGCRGPLEIIDSKVLGIELKVRVLDRQVARFTLHDDAAVTLGRDTIPLPSAEEIRRAGVLSGVSREHARLRVAGRRLHVQDAGSRNGTWLAEWMAHVGRHGEWRRLESGLERRVGRRDVVRLGKSVQLVRSGRLLLTAPTFAD